jgi:hypothetical protein
MELYTCHGCGFDLGSNLLSSCPNCHTNLIGINCLGCSYSGPREVFTKNKCPKCGALVHITSDSIRSLAKTDTANPVVLSISDGVITVWPLLMYGITSSFLIAANVVLFMSFNLGAGAVFVSFMLVASLAVVALNSVVVGGLVVSIGKDVLQSFNQKKVFSAVYLSLLMLILITGYLFIYLGFKGQAFFPAFTVMSLSWIGSFAFTLWLHSRTNLRDDSQVITDTSLIEQYVGIYNETGGVNTLEFEVLHGNLCVGIHEAGHLSKTIVLDDNKFGLVEDNDYIFTFVDSGDHDLVAGDGDIIHFYQRTGG